MTEYLLQSDENCLIAGVDEAGRGPLIFDVVAACVVMPSVFPDDRYKQIKDSKKLSGKKRKEIAEYIKENAITYGIGSASNKEIDDTNILKATLKAMHRAIDQAYRKKSFHKIQVDGNHFNGYSPPGIDSEILPYECVVKGDGKFLNIAAASILAKEYHDSALLQLIENHPELEKYDLRKCQGYGTPKHLQAIKDYGVTEFHRKTFGPCKNS